MRSRPDCSIKCVRKEPELHKRHFLLKPKGFSKEEKMSIFFFCQNDEKWANTLGGTFRRTYKLLLEERRRRRRRKIMNTVKQAQICHEADEL